MTIYIKSQAFYVPEMNSKRNSVHGVSMTPYKKSSKKDSLQLKSQCIQVSYLQKYEKNTGLVRYLLEKQQKMDMEQNIEITEGSFLIMLPCIIQNQCHRSSSQIRGVSILSLDCIQIKGNYFGQIFQGKINLNVLSLRLRFTNFGRTGINFYQCKLISY